MTFFFAAGASAIPVPIRISLSGTAVSGSGLAGSFAVLRIEHRRDAGLLLRTRALLCRTRILTGCFGLCLFSYRIPVRSLCLFLRSGFTACVMDGRSGSGRFGFRRGILFQDRFGRLYLLRLFLCRCLLCRGGIRGFAQLAADKLLRIVIDVAGRRLALIRRTGQQLQHVF